MTEIEKLARDICWIGFADPKHAGCSKAEYWARLPPSTKATYIGEASQLCWTIKRLGGKTIEKLLDAQFPAGRAAVAREG